ncbi:unnamed protein product, partial [Amoebophrya sp. A120]|eukprot:GSA120T00001561001.1
MNLSVFFALLTLVGWCGTALYEQVFNVAHPLADITANWLQGRPDPLATLGFDRSALEKLQEAKWQQALEVAIEKLIDRQPERGAEIQNAFLLLSDAGVRVSFFEQRIAIEGAVRSLLALAALVSAGLVCLYLRVFYLQVVHRAEPSYLSQSGSTTSPAQHHPNAIARGSNAEHAGGR